MKKIFVKADNAKFIKIGCNFTGHLFKDTSATIVFFYKQAHCTKLLVESLKKALALYPVFLGRVTMKNGRAHIDCNNQGIIVEIKHVKTTMAIPIENFTQKPSHYFVQPTKIGNAPLLNIRFTYYIDGMSIGLCWNHSVGDMTTFMLFMKCWSDFAAERIPVAPVIVSDRKHYIHERLSPSYNTPIYMKKTSFGDLIKLSLKVLRHVATRKVLFFHFDKDEIRNMKKAYFKICGKQILTNDAICAHINDVVSKYSSAAAATQFSMIVDFRKSIGIPTEVIGNFVTMMSFEFSQGENPGMIAGKIRSAMNSFQKEYFDYFESERFLEENGGYYSGIIPRFISSKVLYDKVLILNNLSRFGVYDIDFGSISPVLCLPVSLIPLPVSGFLIEGPEKNGILFSLSLQKKIMKRLSQPDAVDYTHRFRESNKTERHSWLT